MDEGGWRRTSATPLARRISTSAIWAAVRGVGEARARAASSMMRARRVRRRGIVAAVVNSWFVDVVSVKSGRDCKNEERKERNELQRTTAESGMPW